MEEKPVRVDTMTAIVNKIERMFGFAPKISGILGEFGALAMVLLIIVGVTFRYALKLPLNFDAEYTGYLLVVISFVGAAYALKAGSHVRVDLIVRLLPKKAHAWIQVTTDIISLGCMGLLLVYTWQIAYSNLVRGVIAMTPTETPLGPIQMLLPLGALLFILQLLIELAKSLRTALSPLPEA